MLDHLKKLVRLFRNKYLSATVLFLIWIAFFDQTSIIYDVHLTQKEKQLKARKIFHEKTE